MKAAPAHTLVLATLFAAACAQMSHTAEAPAALAREGKSDYLIVVAADATPPEQTAAKELQAHLAKVTGATLPIVLEAKAPADARQIVVGPSARLKQLAPDLDVAKLGHDGIVMKTVGHNLLLAGRRPRGTLYAVYTFLEDVVGCRWWTSTESFVPHKPTLALPTLDVTYAPPLRVREAFYRDAFDGVFAARSKCNGHFERIKPEYGGHYSIIGWCHTFFRILPPSKYFATHPEWYSEINGKRSAGRTQLCLTNDEMRKEFTREALAWIRKQPDAGMISISQNDWRNPCQCAKCRAVREAEGSESGPLLRFVNAVAADIEKEFPDFLVETLAYSYTRKPPRHVRPRHNVVVRLCSIECSFVQPLETGKQNEKFRHDIEGWSAVAPKLYIWNYVTNFANYLIPHPNLRVLAPNLRTFVKHKTIGLFEQGDAKSGIGDFVRLRAWLLAHLMWDPTRDDRALIREFLNGYYGPAAPHLLAYLDLIHDTAERSGAYVRCYMVDTATWLPLADLNATTRLFDKAQAAVAADPVLARRVRRERLVLDHVWLTRYHALKRAAKAQNTEFLGPADPVAACAEFIRFANEHSVGNYSEGRPFAWYENRLSRRFRAPGPPPPQCKGLPEGSWLDVQDNEFRLYRYGKWVNTVDDPKASDGKAARMPGSHFEWAVQCPISADMADGNAWRVHVAARCDAKATDGVAMSMGVYDSTAKKGIAHRRVKIEEAAGADYRIFDLGAHKLHAGIYIWVAPPKTPDKVPAVFVDRIFLVREKKPKP